MTFSDLRGCHIGVFLSFAVDLFCWAVGRYIHGPGDGFV